MPSVAWDIPETLTFASLSIKMKNHVKQLNASREQ